MFWINIINSLNLKANIYISFLNCCVPVVAPSSPPKESITLAIPEGFLKPENKIYLVVPIWNESPTIYYDDINQKGKIIIGKGFFVRNDQISDLHNKIPTKASISVGSIVGNVGREVMLTGVWLISDSLEALYVNTVFSRDSLFDLLWAK